MDLVKYEAQVVKLGPLTQEFINGGILVFFGLNAPEELVEFSILIDHTTLHQNIVPGDRLMVGAESFQILAVGEVANQNLANLGHLVVKFNGQNEPELPGDVSVPQTAVPPIEPGTVIKIIADPEK